MKFKEQLAEKRGEFFLFKNVRICALFLISFFADVLLLFCGRLVEIVLSSYDIYIYTW
jgi:hypothetical protein